MNDKRIVVIIDGKGAVQVEAHGHKGGSCKQATSPLVKTLIGEKGEEKEKPEFYQGDFKITISEFE